MKVFPLILLLVSFIHLGESGLQRVLVKGRLLCGTSPAGNVKVKLYDEDVIWDELLDTKYTNATGYFAVDGNTREYTTIDPFINVYHDCNDNTFCQRRLSVYVPDKYINHGDRITSQTDVTQLKIYDVGTVNLEAWIYAGSYDRVCYHESDYGNYQSTINK